MSIVLSLKPLPLALAISLLAAPVLFTTGPAHAQALDTPPDTATRLGPQARHPFDLPAQPLAHTLTQIAEAGQARLSLDAALVRNLQAPPVRGELSIEDAWHAALSGSGLTIRRTGSGAWTVEKDNSTIAALAQITIRGAHHATTEHTGSYATNLPSATSTPLGLDWLDTPQTISVMTQERISDQGLEDIRSVLQNTPGVTVSDMGSERYGIISRGYGMNSYQIDGINTELDITTNNNPQTLADMSIYDHVEVLRGASGLMSGAGDPGGVVNLVRKKPTESFQGSLGTRLGSWDTYRSELDLSGPLNKTASVRGRIIGTYQRNHSFIDYMRTERKLLYGILEADLTETTRLTAGGSHQRNQRNGNFGIYGFPLFWSDGSQTDFNRNFTVASRDAHSDTNTTDGFLTLEQALGSDWQIKLSANYLRGHKDSHHAYAHGDNSLPDALTGKWPLSVYRIDNLQTQKGVTLGLAGSFDLLGRSHDLAFGVSYSSSRTDYDYYPDLSSLDGTEVDIREWHHRGSPTPGSKLSDIDFYTQQRSFYAASRLALTDRLKLVLGTRVLDYLNIYTVANPTFDYFAYQRTQEKGIVTPYAGLTYALDDTHTLYASYSRIYKPGYYRDRYGKMLDPREGGVYEIGIKSMLLDGTLQTSAAIYQTRQDNLAEADGGYYVPGTNWESAYRAIKGAKTTGIDLEASGDLMPGWKLTASYAYGQTKDAEGERIKTTLPRHQFKLWTTWRLPGDWQRLTLGGGINWQSGIHFTDRPWWAGQTLTARQGAYSVVNLMARYEVNDRLTATLNVGNVLDRKYLSSLDNTFYSGYYGAPRNAMLDLKYRF